MKFSLSDQNKPPIDAELLEYTFPEIRRRQLSSGLQIIIIEHHKLPKVYLRLGMDFGIKNDPDGQEGLSQLMEMVLKKGTAEKSYRQIIDSIDQVGGELDAAVNQDFFVVYGEFLSEHLEYGLQLLSEVALNPAFPEAELEKERQKLIADLENEKSSPAFLAQRRMDKILFNRHPYSKHKTLETIRNIQRQHLLEFHRTRVSPENSYLVMAGDITEDRAVRLAEKYFSGWKTRPAAEDSVPAPREQNNRQIHLVNRPGSEQCNLLLGNLLFSRNHRDYEKMLVMNKILGGGGNGRLFLYLREEKGYTYGAYSTLQNYKSQGAWLANAEVRPEVTGQSLEAFLEQFEKIKSEPVSGEDLKNARRFLMGIFPLQNETAASVAALALQQHLYRLPEGYWERYQQAIENVTVEDVREMARRYIADRELSVVVVGDAEKLSGQLAPFGEVRVYDLEDQPV